MLEYRVNFSYFVEEQCPTVCLYEESGAIIDGTGEGASDMSEQFARQHLGSKCGAIDGSERFFSSGTEAMNRSGHEFFSGSGFSPNQYARLGSCDPFNETKQGTHLVRDGMNAMK